jgi:hypothetical protein
MPAAKLDRKFEIRERYNLEKFQDKSSFHYFDPTAMKKSLLGRIL